MKKHFITLIICLLVFPLMAGATWTFKRLTWNSGVSLSPSSAIDPDGNIHLVWENDTPGNYEIYYKKSTNGGNSWTTKRITWNSGWSNHPDITLDTGDGLHLVWEDYTPSNWEVYYKKSIDEDASWISQRMTWNSGHSNGSCIITDSSYHVHIFWHDTSSGNHEIFYKKSD